MKSIHVPPIENGLSAALQQATDAGERTLRIHLEPGRHGLTETLRLNPRDWDHLILQGADDGSSVLSSGRVITEWTPTQINGLAAWEAPIASDLECRQLFADGIRLSRAAWPKHNRHTPPSKRLQAVHRQPDNAPLFPEEDDPANRFRLDAEDMARGQALIGTEVVCFHHWIEERHPITAIDEEGWLVSSRQGSCTKNEHSQLARYFIDNLREELTEPGEWFLDRQAGRIYLITEPEQDPNRMQILAPTLTHLIRVDGDGGEGGRIEFEDLSFAHTEWQMAYGGRREEVHRAQSEIFRNLETEGGYAGFGQAAAQSPAAIELRQVDEVRFVNCRFEHLGAYALFIGENCHQHEVRDCHFRDLGAGGIHLSGDLPVEGYCPEDCCGAISANDRALPVRDNGHHRIEGNHFEDGGHVFPSGIPILLRHSHHNLVRANHIHDFYYSGISCGWIWWFGPHPTHHNLIEDNHIHSLGHRWLSDMGGIYLLGEQEGTEVRNNHVYDISCQVYGGWGIYLDYSTSHVLIEKNRCHGPLEECCVIHFGRDNEIRHNLFAFGSGGTFQLGRGDEDTPVANFHHNLLLVNDQPLYKGGYKMDWVRFPKNLNAHHNQVWNYGTQPLRIDNLGARNLTDTPVDGDGDQWKLSDTSDPSQRDWISLADWQALGYDQHLREEDPHLRDPLNGDFRNC